jgi:hypothetical protein
MADMTEGYTLLYQDYFLPLKFDGIISANSYLSAFQSEIEN